MNCLPRKIKSYILVLYIKSYFNIMLNMSHVLPWWSPVKIAYTRIQEEKMTCSVHIEISIHIESLCNVYTVKMLNFQECIHWGWRKRRPCLTHLNFHTRQGPKISVSNIRDIAFYRCSEIIRTRILTIFTLFPTIFGQSMAAFHRF